MSYRGMAGKEGEHRTMKHWTNLLLSTSTFPYYPQSVLNITPTATDSALPLVFKYYVVEPA